MNRAFDDAFGSGIEQADTAIVEEARKGRRALEHVAHRLDKARSSTRRLPASYAARIEDEQP
jgi:hypothetical protein